MEGAGECKPGLDGEPKDMPTTNLTYEAELAAINSRHNARRVRLLIDLTMVLCGFGLIGIGQYGLGGAIVASVLIVR